MTIIHSTVIDKPMYEQLLGADLVIADLSTSNANAIYELGVRHALRPHTTIVMAESNFEFPFDLSHLSMLKYEHMGKGIDHGEVQRVKAELKKKIAHLLESSGSGQPGILVLPSLADTLRGRPKRKSSGTAAAAAMAARVQPVSDESFAELMDAFKAAKAEAGGFAKARDGELPCRQGGGNGAGGLADGHRLPEGDAEDAARRPIPHPAAGARHLQVGSAGQGLGIERGPDAFSNNSLRRRRPTPRPSACGAPSTSGCGTCAATRPTSTSRSGRTRAATSSGTTTTTASTSPFSWTRGPSITDRRRCAGRPGGRPAHPSRGPRAVRGPARQGQPAGR